MRSSCLAVNLPSRRRFDLATIVGEKLGLWLEAHPKAVNAGEAGAPYLVKGPEHPTDAEGARLKQTSCDVKVSVVCMKAWADGYRLTKDFYIGDRARITHVCVVLP